jgi:GNAT superfamily N-acetyltransferase
MPFQLAEWESAQSDLPYYFGTVDDALPVADLGPGIYVIRSVIEKEQEGLVRLGYQYLDTLLELTLARAERPLEMKWQVRHVGEQDRDTAILLSAQSDVIFGNGTANRLYRTLPAERAAVLMNQWTYNSILERSERAGQINGHSFVTVRAIDEYREQIDLMGVHPDHRGNGFGTSLATWAAWTSNRPILTVRTELKNSGAIGVYLKAGFRPSGFQTTYWARVTG